MLDFSHEFNNYSTVDLNCEFNIHFMGYYLNTYFIVYFNDYFAMHFSLLSLKKIKFMVDFGLMMRIDLFFFLSKFWQLLNVTPWLDTIQELGAPNCVILGASVQRVQCEPLIAQNRRVGSIVQFWGHVYVWGTRMSPGQGGELQEGGWVSRAALFILVARFHRKAKFKFKKNSELSDFGGFQLPKEVRKNY